MAAPLTAGEAGGGGAMPIATPATHLTAHTDQYVGLAPAYVATKLLPFRTLVERPALLELWREALGAAATPAPTALDLACGDGWYSRVMLREWGAAAVHGVDLSPDMIAAGRVEPVDGLTLTVGDCADATAIARLGTFDVVVAAYLISYATTEAELTAMFAGAAAALKEGHA